MKNKRFCFQCEHRVVPEDSHTIKRCKYQLWQDQSIVLQKDRVAVDWADKCSRFERRKDDGID
jgi:hypothetical protein